MLLEQVYLLYIYILLFELAIVIGITVALLVILFIAMRKTHHKKHIYAGH